MILIIDSNILFAALLKDSLTRSILISSPLTLYAPENLITEIRKYETEILARTGYGKDEFELLFTLITENVHIIEKTEYLDQLEQADQLIGNKDKGDIPFLALALSIPNDGIWTQNTKHYTQKKIKTWTTEELIKKISSAT